MKRVLFLALAVFTSIVTLAQEYIEEGKKRLNFAKSYFELGAQFTPSFTGFTTTQSIRHSASITPQLNIGGLHFWGHCEFYIAIPLTQFTLQKNNEASYRLSQSVATGARLLPWAYQNKKIRPFIGASWAVINFKQDVPPNNDQPLLSRNKIVLDAGVLYGNKDLMFRIGMNFTPTNKWNYPIAHDQFREIKTPHWTPFVGFIYSIETTKAKNMETENARMNQFSRTSSPTMYAIKAGDWFVGIGPSTSFMLATSEYNQHHHPYFNKKPVSGNFFDMSLGYQFNRLGLVTALSFRNPTFTNKAFGTTQTITKTSFAFEVFKYLTDYSGFTPYAGINVAYDNIRFEETSNDANLDHRFRQLNPGVTLGWDILPGKTEQWFVLRTNIRWYPFASVRINGLAYSQNQIEYNVIQAVFYPSRFKHAQQKRDKH